MSGCSSRSFSEFSLFSNTPSSFSKGPDFCRHHWQSMPSFSFIKRKNTAKEIKNKVHSFNDMKKVRNSKILLNGYHFYSRNPRTQLKICMKHEFINWMLQEDCFYHLFLSFLISSIGLFISFNRKMSNCSAILKPLRFMQKTWLRGE